MKWLLLKYLSTFNDMLHQCLNSADHDSKYSNSRDSIENKEYSALISFGSHKLPLGACALIEEIVLKVMGLMIKSAVNRMNASVVQRAGVSGTCREGEQPLKKHHFSSQLDHQDCDEDGMIKG